MESLLTRIRGEGTDRYQDQIRVTGTHTGWNQRIRSRARGRRVITHQSKRNRNKYGPEPVEQESLHTRTREQEQLLTRTRGIGTTPHQDQSNRNPY